MPSTESKPFIILNILCGGKGKRIGGNKPFYIYKDKPMILHIIEKLKNHCDEIIISLDNDSNPNLEAFKALGFTIVFDDDRFIDKGAITGVFAGLKYAANIPNSSYITIPCDMPQIDDDYISNLLISVPAFYSGENDYPLCAHWPSELLGTLENELINCGRGLGAYRFLQSIGAQKVPALDEAKFLNVNEKV